MYNYLEKEILKKSRKTPLTSNKQKLFTLPMPIGYQWAVAGVYYEVVGEILSSLKAEMKQAKAMEEILADNNHEAQKPIHKNHINTKFEIAKKHRDTKSQIVF